MQPSPIGTEVATYASPKDSDKRLIYEQDIIHTKISSRALQGTLKPHFY